VSVEGGCRGGGEAYNMQTLKILPLINTKITKVKDDTK
jgi:hypothetical protein